MSDQHPQERFTSFKQRLDIREVVSRYAEWPRSANGMQATLQLSNLAMLRLRCRMSKSQHERAVRKIAATSGIPAHDFALLAQCQLEAVRCLLAGSGQIPFNPAGWDAEDTAE